jgi:hypothetical protein
VGLFGEFMTIMRDFLVICDITSSSTLKPFFSSKKHENWCSSAIKTLGSQGESPYRESTLRLLDLPESAKPRRRLEFR